MEKLGFSQGRILTQFPKGWIKELLEKSESHITRAYIFEKLKNKKYKDDRMVKSGLPYDGNMEWATNAERLASNFDRIIVQKGVDRIEEAFILAQIANINEEFFETEREIQALNTVQELTRPAEIFLKVSNQVAIIDPYFDVMNNRQECLKVLARFFEIAINSGRCTTFTIYTKNKFCPEDKGIKAKTDFEKLLTCQPSLPFKIFFIFISENSFQTAFHARYFLSEKGGLRYDKGFRAPFDPELVDISLLDKVIHSNLCNLYLKPISQLENESDWTWTF
jgi:hypothetical protein